MTAVLIAADIPPVPPGDGLPPGQPYVSPDDLASIPPLFAEAAQVALLPLVAEIWQNSAGTVHAQLVDAANLPGLPPVSSLAAETYLAQAANTFSQVGDDLWATARSELLAGFEAGESIPQLADRLRNSAGLTARKATLVARTQVLDASNAGSYATAQTSGIDLRKGWLDTPDNRTRITHRAAGAQYGADQQMIPLAEQFMVGGYSCDRPHDPSLPIGERASCRCSLIYSMGTQAAEEARKAAEPAPPLPNTSGQIEPAITPALPAAPLVTVEEIRQIEVENAIRAAYRAHGRDGDYVGLAEIRAELGTTYSRAEVDATLRRLAIDPDSRANIVPQSNQKALTEADRAAALHIGGQERHFLHFEDASPRPLPRVGGPGPLPELSQRTVVQLRALAKQQGIPGYSKLTKPQLLERLAARPAVSTVERRALVEIPVYRPPVSLTAEEQARAAKLVRSDPQIVATVQDRLGPISTSGNLTDADAAWLQTVFDREPAFVNRLAQEASIKANLARAAGKAGQTPAVFDREVGDKLRGIFADKPVAVRVSDEAALRGILTEGRFKTQFEGTKRAGDLTADVEHRRLSEQINGVAPDLPPGERPVYGYVSVNGVEPALSAGRKIPGIAQREGAEDVLSQYGRIQVVLKPEVRARTTATVGDSLDQIGFTRPSPVDVPSAFSARPGYSFKTSDLDQLTEPGWTRRDYVEAQIHGGVRLDDIAEVVFPDEPSAALKTALAEKSIRWRVLRDVEVLPPQAAPVLEGRVLREAARERNRIIEQRAAAEQTLAELDDLLVKKAGREAFEQRIAAAQLDPADLAALRAAVGDPAKLRAAVTRISKKQGITVQAKTGAKVKFDPALHDPVGEVPAAGTPVVVIRRGTTLTVDGDTITLNKAVVKLPTAPVKRAPAKAVKAAPKKATAPEVPVSSDPRVAALPRTVGKPPTPAKAAKATNPKFGTTQQGPSYRDAGKAGRPYTPEMGPLPSGAFEENCTNVVHGFEMRMRGFDVQAAPLDVLDKYGYAAGRTYPEIDQLLTDAWRLPDGTPHGRGFSGQQWRSFTAIDEEIDRTWPDGGRGFITVGKHIFNVVKVRGKAVYYEAQFDANTTRNVTALYKRKYRDASGFSGGPQEAKLFRVDDLQPAGGILNTIIPI